MIDDEHDAGITRADGGPAGEPGRPSGRVRRRPVLLVGGALVVAAAVAIGIGVSSGGGHSGGNGGGSTDAAPAGPAIAAGRSAASAPAGAHPTATGTDPKAAGPLPGATRTDLATAPTSVDPPAARAAACGMTAKSIRSLVTPDPRAPAAGPADLLRDAVPNLNSNIASWADAAAGRPQLAAAVGVVNSVRAHWTAALAAYDSGDERTGQTETKAGEADLARLDPLVAAARTALSARC